MRSKRNQRTSLRQGTKSRSLQDRLQSAIESEPRGTLVEIRKLRSITPRSPISAQALCEQALSQYSQNRYDVAVELFEWALEIQKDPVLFNNLALAQARLGEPEKAIASLATALELNDRYVEAWVNLGNTLVKLDRAGDALAVLRRAIELSPDSVEALINLGAALQRQSKHQEASVYFGKATKLRPSSVQAWLGLGGSLTKCGELSGGEYSYRQAVELDKLSTETHLSLGNNLYLQGRIDEAVGEFNLAKSRSSDVQIDIRCAQVISALPSSEEEIIRQRAKLAAEIERLSNTQSTVEHLSSKFAVTNFYLAYHGLNDRLLQQTWARMLLRVCPSLNWVAPHCDSNRSGRDRIRIGFISSYLHSHTIARFTNGIMRELPRDRFEVIVFDCAPAAETDELDWHVDKVIRCGGSLQDMRAAIAAEELDVAFYPEIGMSTSIYFLAQSRLAPVQCTTWGHPVTTGLPNIDYFLSSTLVEPDNPEEHYSERLVQLPTLPTYYYQLGNGQNMRQRFEFPTSWRTYLCPQSLFKFHPAFDETLADILDRDRNGRLLLIDTSSRLRETLTNRLSQKYPNMLERVVFLERMSTEELLTLMRSAVVMLDTMHFGGGNTSYEALAFGAPVVTCPGEFMRGRVTLGCYRKMAFEECVAPSPQAYSQLAVRVANDSGYRSWLVEEILKRNHTLYEDNKAITSLAGFLSDAVTAHA